MLGSFQLNFILMYSLCGFSVAYVGVYILKHQYLGRTWGAIFISIIGSFLGALISSMIFKSSMTVFNIFSAVSLAGFSLYIYGKASKYHHD